MKIRQYIYTLAAGTMVLFSAEAFAQQVDTTDRWSEVPVEALPEYMELGSVSRVAGDDLKSSYNGNIYNALIGRVAGLTIGQSNGESAGDTPSTLIRGIGTWAGTAPLVILDGFASTIDIVTRLTPAEIGSIEILKDAAATAIYGNRGANGVLVINTKHGEAKPLKIDFDARCGFQTAIRMPEMLDAYNYATLYNEALVNEGKDPLYSDEALEHYRTGDSPYMYPNINWQKELMRKASPLAMYNLVAQGGNNTVRYMVAFNGTNNTGLLKDPTAASIYAKKQNFYRYNFRTNVDVRLNKRFSATVWIGGSIENKVTPGTSESAWNLVNSANTIPANAFPIIVEDGNFGGNSAFSNPLADLTETGYISYNAHTAQAAIRLTEKLDFITPGLSVNGAISFNTYYKAYSSKTRSYARYEVYEDASGELGYNAYGQETTLSADESSASLWRNFAVDGSIAYRRSFGKHSVDALAKVMYDEYTSSSGTLPYKNINIAGRAAYSYDQRYSAEFIFSEAANDNMPKGSRFGFFPTGAIGWTISNEDFLKGSKAVSYLKLKASAGLVGNSSIGGSRYQYNQYYAWAGYYYFGANTNGVDTYLESIKANPEVTWEKDIKCDIALESAFYDNHVVFNFDYFYNHRTDILCTPYSSMPSWLGYSRPNMNIGIADNTGFETTIGYRETERDFKYHVNASLWYAHSNIVFNSEAPQLYEYRYSTGHRIGQPFALEAIGFFKDQDDIDNSPVQSFAQVIPGDIKYKDQNGDNVIDEDDYVPYGYSGTPEISFAFDLGFEYKGFDIKALFQGVTNRQVYLEGAQYRPFQSNGNISTVALGRWTPETADTATFPRLSTAGNQNNYLYSSFWLRDGSFLKLRSAEFGYTFATKLLEKAKIEGIRLYVVGTNLFSLDYMNGYNDPETLYGYPAVRTYSFGVNVKF